MRTYRKDLLEFEVFATRDEMGAKAASDAEACIRRLLEQKDEINIVFAAAPSQNDFLKYLSKKDIEWSRINAFHMDEYIGLAQDAPQGFGNFLAAGIFDLVPFKSVNYIYSNTETPEQICARYEKLLADRDIDIVFMGIGENGHIAFNDPHVCLFDDPKGVKVVSLDRRCRQQQVNDGCFKTLEDVPEYAITLTVPTLMRGKYLFVMVPTELKAEAIGKVFSGEITEQCPASILRAHKNAVLYTDEAGAKFLGKQ